MGAFQLWRRTGLLELTRTIRTAKVQSRWLYLYTYLIKSSRFQFVGSPTIRFLKSWHYLGLKEDQRVGVTIEQTRKQVWRMCIYCALSFASANLEEDWIHVETPSRHNKKDVSLRKLCSCWVDQGFVDFVEPLPLSQKPTSWLFLNLHKHTANLIFHLPNIQFNLISYLLLLLNII